MELNPGVAPKGPGECQPGQGKYQAQTGKASKPDGRGSEEVVDRGQGDAGPETHDERGVSPEPALQLRGRGRIESFSDQVA